MSETTKAGPSDTDKILHRLNVLIAQQKRVEAATLTAALLDKRRKALSIAEVLEIARDIEFACYPQPHNPQYQEWVKTKDERLNFVHK
jgi:hypothetical protein